VKLPRRSTLPFRPDCSTYRVSATFTGRIDSVLGRFASASKANVTRLARLQGFGHMGMFDAQLVVQSVKNVVATTASESRSPRINHGLITIQSSIRDLSMTCSFVRMIYIK